MDERKLPTPATVAEEYLFAMVIELRKLNLVLSSWVPLAPGAAPVPATLPAPDSELMELREPVKKGRKAAEV